MPTELAPRADDEVLKDAIERHINQRSWGRIHRLQVEVFGDRLVVHGSTATYYAKQLALEAALEAINSIDAAAVELDIQVGPGRLPTPRALSLPLAPAYGH